ncbi:MAG: subclass B3 metallo-beta-lactamase [Acidobacteria bacterium]|nr:subclass B3 metallo-beta-lactamase [Acidobacteriota bacterium]
MSRRVSARPALVALSITALTAITAFTFEAPRLHAQARPTAPVPAQPALVPDPPHVCTNCAEWNAPRQPFKLYGNTYFVGPGGLSALLITSPQGHILVDAGLEQSAAVIDANIRALGFKTTDVKLILTSHGHFDHVGGVHALARYTKAEVVGSPQTARALAIGAPTPDDPQAPPTPPPGVDYFPAHEGVRGVKDGETVRVGPLSVTAHHVPGHTPGATTWTWQSCEGSRCLNMVYADSLSTVASDGFRFTGGNGRPSIVESFRASITKFGALPCDIMVSTHPSMSNLDEKLKKRATVKPGDPDPFIDPGACKALAAASMKSLEDRVKQERAKR